MGALFDKIAEWLKGILVDASIENLTNLFDSVNEEVQNVAGQVGTSPARFAPSIFDMIRNKSETVILPIAGVILTFVACYELIQLVTDHNNLAQLDTWIIFKWVFKTFIAVTIVANTFTIVMGLFDVAQHVINQSGSLISGSTAITSADTETIRETLEDMEVGALLHFWVKVWVKSRATRQTSISCGFPGPLSFRTPDRVSERAFRKEGLLLWGNPSTMRVRG